LTAALNPVILVSLLFYSQVSSRENRTEARGDDFAFTIPCQDHDGVCAHVSQNVSITHLNLCTMNMPETAYLTDCRVIGCSPCLIRQ
jgi:hypothetical protein